MPRQIECTAYHEAGHAAAYLALDRRFQHVTIEPKEDETGGSLGHCLGVADRHGAGFATEVYEGTPRARRWLEQRAMVLAAGNVAERYFTKRRIVAGSISDFSYIADALDGLCGDEDEASAYCAWITFRTRNLLLKLDNWVVVDALAKALLDRRTLTYKEAREIADTERRRIFEMSHEELNQMWQDVQNYIAGCCPKSGAAEAAPVEKPAKKTAAKATKKTAGADDHLGEAEAKPAEKAAQVKSGKKASKKKATPR